MLGLQLIHIDKKRLIYHDVVMDRQFVLRFWQVSL